MFVLNACVAQGFCIFTHFLPAMGIETDFMGFWRCRNKRTMDLTDKETSVQWPDMQCLFLQEWWWDAVCPPAERLVLGLDEAASAGTAFWPLAKVKRYGGMFSVLSMPPLTQHSGPWLADRASFSTLLSHLPRTANIKMNLSFALSEKAIQQARQAGIRVSEGATYVIRDCRDLEKVFASIKPAQQRQIRKGMRNLHLLPEADAEMLISLQQETFARQGRKSPYPEKVVRRLCETVQRHEAGRLVALADAEENVMACGLFVWDNNRCYSLTHGFHKTGQNVGAGSLLQWEGIRIAAEKGLIFDFEGSNIESIARFNSSFGSIKETYSRLERYSWGMKMLEKASILLKK